MLLFALIGAGCLVLVSVVVARGRELAAPFGGFSAIPRAALQAVTGIFATAILVWFLINFRRRVAEPLHNADFSDDKIGEFASEHFKRAHLLQGALVGVVAVCAGILFVYGPLSAQWVVTSAAAMVVLVAPLQTKQPPRLRLKPTENSWLDASSEFSVGWAVLFVAGIAIAMAPAAYVVGPLPNWIHTPKSRDAVARFVEIVAEAYILGMVGIVLASVVYSHAWCKELDSAVRRDPLRWPEATNDRIRYSYNLFLFVGRLTAISNRMMSGVLAVVLVFILGYHPLISPSAAPLGLLLTTSIGAAILVGSALSLRWYFLNRRASVLADIDDEMARVRVHHDAPAFKRELTDDGRSLSLCLWPDAYLDQARETTSREEWRAILSPNISGGATLASEMTTRLDDVETARLEVYKKQISSISDGVFEDWNQSPLSWIIGGSTLLALVDWWIRAFATAG
jgi:hypothetical protein